MSLMDDFEKLLGILGENASKLCVDNDNGNDSNPSHLKPLEQEDLFETIAELQLQTEQQSAETLDLQGNGILYINTICLLCDM